MENLFDFEKKVEFVFKKRQINNIPCQVACAVDISGSMASLYRKDVVQKVTEKMLAIGMVVDKDKQIDFWTFDDGNDYIGTVTPFNINGFVQREVIDNKNINKWGSTVYSGMMNSIVEHFFKVEKIGFIGKFFGKNRNESTKDPVLCLLMTDGEPNHSDKDSIVNIIEEHSDKNIYWQIVCIGNDNFKFVENLADYYPNVGFVHIDNIETINDEKFYEEIINDEFAEWVIQFK